jgi:hypothetical protein
LQAPFRAAGLAGTNRLAYLLGLSPTGYSDGGVTDVVPRETAEQIRARLLSQYTRNSTTTPSASWTDNMGRPVDINMYENTGAGAPQLTPPGFPVTTSTVDEAGLSAAITAEQEKQRQAAAQQGQAAQDAASRDPLYGSLMRDFTMADYQADPGYAFRLSEGMKGLERSAAARGGLMSGRAMKDTLRFAQDLGSQEYGNAYNRFQTNQGNKFNRLAAIAGIGQTATNQVQNAAQNYAAGAGQAIQAGGNARASGYVGGANAINQGIGQGINMWQQNRMLNMLQQPQQTYGGWGISGGGGFGTGAGFGNQDYGQNF